MADFINLAPELIWDIADFLPRKDKVSLSLVCWRMNHLISPILFREISLPVSHCGCEQADIYARHENLNGILKWNHEVR